MDIENWVNYCSNLRKGVVSKGENTKFLLTNFLGTKQQKDIEKRTPLIQDFFRIKINVKGWDEKEMEKIGKKPVDFSDMGAVFQTMRDEFDIPYWPFFNTERESHKEQPLENLKKYNNVFVYQINACNLFCPWCYVDDKNKEGRTNNNSRFFSMSEIIDVFEEERKKQDIYIFRISGGEPTLAVEQWLEALTGLRSRGLEKDIYIWGDTNLTTGHFIDHLQSEGELDKNLLEKVGEFPNFGVLCSFKGTDPESFLRATGLMKINGSVEDKYSFLEEERWYSFSKLVKAGIDAYPFIYDPNPNTIEKFMEKGAKMFGEDFYLKAWISRLKLYGPEKERLKHIRKNPEDYQKELDYNFNRSKEVMQDIIWRKLGINYQAISRTGIELKVK